VEEQRVLVIVDFASPPEIWQGLGDGWALYTVEKNRARSRMVGVGHRNGLVAEIVLGLPEGAAVIAHPDYAVKDGTRVKAR
jgi:HlyD family secretion protein